MAWLLQEDGDLLLTEAGDELALDVAGPPATDLALLLAGVPGRVRCEGLSIRDVLNDAPNACNLTVDSPAPVGSESLRIEVGARLLFAGQLQTTELSYQGKEDGDARPVYPCTGIDDTTWFNRRRPFGSWDSVSATTIAQQLIAEFATGFSNAGIEPSLPPVSLDLDGSEGFGGAMSQLATLIGGYWRVEDGVAYLFTTDTSDPPDDIDDTPGRFEDNPPITLSIDTSQQRTRVFGKGAGSTALVDVDASDSIIPIEDPRPFTTWGGKAISETQRFAYAGVDAGLGRTTTLDPGDTVPSFGGLTVTQAAIDGAMTPGAYRYAVAFGTSEGQTIPSARVTATVLAPVTGGTGGGGAVFISGAIVPGGSFFHVATIVTALGESGPQAWGSVVVNPAIENAIRITNPPFSDARILSIRHYIDGVLVADLATPSEVFDVLGIAGVHVGVPETNETWGKGQCDLTAIPLSANPLATSRILYRSRRDGWALYELATIGDNTTTTFTDNTPDEGLGAPAPVVGSLGIAPGATSLPVFSPSNLGSNGWVRIGSQLIRYPTIPSSGVGSITATIPRGSLVEAVPALTGVWGLTRDVLAGAPINIWVQRDDLTAQAEQAAIDLANGVDPPDGIIEGPPIVDDRRTEASLTALLDARLVQFARPIKTVRYACRDLKTKSGKPVHFDVTVPRIGPFDLTIQDVTITEIGLPGNVPPKFTVSASSVRFSLEAILKRLMTERGLRT